MRCRGNSTRPDEPMDRQTWRTDSRKHNAFTDIVGVATNDGITCFIFMFIVWLLCTLSGLETHWVGLNLTARGPARGKN